MHVSRMTVNSKFVINWEIDNAAARLATGKAESGVFDEGGFRWTATVERSSSGYVELTLRCDVVHNGAWKCEAHVMGNLINTSGRFCRPMEGKFCFNDDTPLRSCSKVIWWSTLLQEPYLVDDKVTVKFNIEIISADRGEPIVDRVDTAKFIAPNRMSNMILTIGEKKLYVSKEILSLHSPVFETLFFGNFAEKEKKEIEIKDVVYEEFIDLLNLIYFRTREITDQSVIHILKLADKFQMEDVMDQSKKHLMQSKGMDVVKKLLLAEQYRLVSLRDHCLNSFPSVTDLTRTIKPSPEYANLSDCTKGAICDRIMELTTAR